MAFSPFQILIVVGYVGMWTAQTLVVRVSRKADGSGYAYNMFGAALMIEFCKFVFSMGMGLSRDTEAGPTLSKRWELFVEHVKGFRVFLLAAFCYLIYNVLMFYNLANYDPSTYRVLMYLRVFFGAFFFRFYLKRTISSRQLVALGILVFGCALNRYRDFIEAPPLTMIGAVLLQAAVAALGSAANEHALKSRKVGGAVSDTNFQNATLYLLVIALDFLAIAFFQPQVLAPSTFFEGYDAWAWLTVIMSAICGISTAMFLKHLDMLLKELAGGALMITTLLSNPFFNIPLHWESYASIIVVCVSIYLYRSKPAAPVASIPLRDLNGEVGKDVVMSMDHAQSAHRKRTDS